jgi:hypothetical protein
VIFVFWAADLFDVRELVLDRFGNPVLGHHVVERSGQAAFGARPVIACDVDDQRVVGVG